MVTLKTIDAHVGGRPVRLITEGAPPTPGKTMRAKRESLARRADGVRRMLMLEPRGHADMSGAMLTEPVSPGAHAGLIFMNASGYGALSVDGVVATTTIAIERGLVSPGGNGQTIVYDTAAGVIKTRAVVDDSGKVERVVVQMVPCFVSHAGLTIQAVGRRIRADIAFGGVFYAVVDAESVGLSTQADSLAALRHAGQEIVHAVEAVERIVHPLDPSTQGLFGTLFTSPPADTSSHLRAVAVLAGGEAGRSPSGTGMAAVIAVLDAMGLVDVDVSFVQEGLVGSRFTGRVVRRTVVGDTPAVVAEIEATAWLTGEHVWFAEAADPFGLGVRL